MRFSAIRNGLAALLCVGIAACDPYVPVPEDNIELVERLEQNPPLQKQRADALAVLIAGDGQDIEGALIDEIHYAAQVLKEAGYETIVLGGRKYHRQCSGSGWPCTYDGVSSQYGLESVFSYIESNREPEDAVLVYFTGHGDLLPEDTAGFLLPGNKYLTKEEIGDMTANIGSSFFFFDTCYSGAFGREVEKQGHCTVTTTQPDEEGHSVNYASMQFFRLFISQETAPDNWPGMFEIADTNSDGNLTAREAFMRLRMQYDGDKFSRSKRMISGEQVPQLYCDNPDIVLSRR